MDEKLDESMEIPFPATPCVTSSPPTGVHLPFACRSRSGRSKAWEMVILNDNHRAAARTVRFFDRVAVFGDLLWCSIDLSVC